MRLGGPTQYPGWRRRYLPRLACRRAPGNDTLTGGVGEDLFIFSPGDGEDVIKNFNQAEDGLKLADFGLSGITT